MVVLGLVLLLAAVVVGVAGALSNGGTADGLPGGFDLFGYSFTGSEGGLFVAGIVVGAVGLFGLALVLAGSRSSARKARMSKRELKRSRKETVLAQRNHDQLLREQERATAVAPTPNGPAPLTGHTGRPVAVAPKRHFWSGWFGGNRRAAHIG